MNFNLHFRVREGDNWNFSKDGGNWNGIATSNDIDSVNANQSDLLGYLAFTDNDVRYQKMKVKKSFIRLSFFNSDDPLEQSLLYYSTIFLDGGSLFGKYMKVRNEMIKKKLVVDDPDEPAAVIKYSGDTEFTTRVDSQFSVMDEYQMEKSSEGFNIYMFADDVPNEGENGSGDTNEENDDNTIYMKVEFNHAGLGRTIPFVAWPKDGSLKFSDIRKYLYIPIKIAYINGRYCYYPDIKDYYNKNIIEFDNENRTISFNLFEPILS